MLRHIPLWKGRACPFVELRTQAFGPHFHMKLSKTQNLHMQKYEENPKPSQQKCE
jgi:hypothetical protein